MRRGKEGGCEQNGKRWGQGGFAGVSLGPRADRARESLVRKRAVREEIEKIEKTRTVSSWNRKEVKSGTKIRHHFKKKSQKGG